MLHDSLPQSFGGKILDEVKCSQLRSGQVMLRRKSRLDDHGYSHKLSLHTANMN